LSNNHKLNPRDRQSRWKAWGLPEVKLGEMLAAIQPEYAPPTVGSKKGTHGSVPKQKKTLPTNITKKESHFACGAFGLKKVDQIDPQDSRAGTVPISTENGTDKSKTSADPFKSISPKNGTDKSKSGRLRG